MTANRRTLIAGNWKMNGLQSDGLALAYSVGEYLKAKQDASFEMLVCPPFTMLAQAN
ncbi:MAG: triose-phosphate isomerase, partial [Alphaproteobacteria bacterium]